MNAISKKFSASTSHLAKQAIEVASTTIQAANNAISAGLQTCDEKGASKTLDDTEIRVSATGVVTHHFVPSSKPSSSGGRLDKPDIVFAGGVAFSASAPNASNRRVWGDNNFNFSIDIESESNSTDAACVRASAKTANGKANLPIVCKWKRQVGELLFEMPEIVGDRYYISADDVGCKLVVEATPADISVAGGGVPATGTGHAEMGPFEISAATRKSLDGALAGESIRFPVILLPEEKKSSTEADDNVVLNISTQEVKITKPGPRNVGYTHEWTGRYGHEFPQVKLFVNTSLNFQLVLSSKESDTLNLSALSRSQRDLIALGIRCFHAQQFVATAAILEHITRRTHMNGNIELPFPSSEEGVGSDLECTDLFVLIQRLMSEVSILMEKQEKFSRERNRAVAEKETLEQDITATIEAYQQLLLKSQKGQAKDEGLLNTSSMSVVHDVTQRAAYIADLETRLHESTSQCKKYINDLELLRRDFMALQSKVRLREDEESQKSHNNGDKQQKVKMLEQQVESLSKLNIELAKRKQEEETYTGELVAELERLRLPDSTNVTKSSIFSTFEDINNKNSEITRLKKDLNSATLDTQSLNSEINTLRLQNKELSENFLYIKEKYDSLQQGQAIADDESDRRVIELQRELRITREKVSSLEHELAQAQTTIEAVLTEKKRLLKKNDSLAKDLNKSRSDLTTSVQRLIQANEQLLGEKTLAESSLKTLERTVEDQKQKLSQSTLDLSPEIRKNAADTVQLLTQIKDKDLVIKQLQSDNETLKSRVRKLATMS